MIKKCIELWDKNKNKLKEGLSKDKKLNSCDYKYLVQLVVENILNEEEDIAEYGRNFDSENITEIDNGDYQGTLLFLIPKDTYQPSEEDYLMTAVSYGSCSGCDTLQAIQSWDWEETIPTKQQLEDYMILCLHLMQNMRKPYKTRWSYDDGWDIKA